MHVKPRPLSLNAAGAFLLSFISVRSDNNNQRALFLFFNPLIPVCCNLPRVMLDTELCC